jgi:hypothetical protein
MPHPTAFALVLKDFAACVLGLVRRRLRAFFVGDVPPGYSRVWSVAHHAALLFDL